MRETRLERLTQRAFAALLVGGLFLVGCGDGGSSSSGGEGDNNDTPSLAIHEDQISAEVGESRTVVRFVLDRKGPQELAGTLRVDLIDLQDGSLKATSQRDFEADEAAYPVEVPLSFGVPADTEPAQLASYTLSYRVDWDGPALWGRRSLFAARDAVETQLLGPDTLRTESTSYLRVMTRDPRTGAAIADRDVQVELTRATGEAEGDSPAPTETLRVFSGHTDAFGNLSIELRPGDALAGPATLKVTVDTPSGPQYLTAQVEIERATKIMLTTDKPLYQPGQVIHLRALALRRPLLTPDAAQPLAFDVFDGKDNKVEHLVTTTDDYGVASAKFQLAKEVNMGTYRIVATSGTETAEKTVTVDRYALPKYDLDLNLEQSVYLAGDTLRGTLSAQYFFGQPVRGGQVIVEAATHDVARTVFSETQGVTDDAGLFSFSVRLPNYIVGLPLEQGGGLVELALIVTDTAGQSRSVIKTIRVAKGALEVAVVPESGELVPGLENLLLIQCRDASGEPAVATHQVEIGDEPAVEIRTDATGLASLPVQVTGESLHVKVTSRDQDDHEVVTETDLKAVAGQADGVVLVRTERALYKVGDTLNVEVQTIGAPERVFLDVIRGGQTILTQALTPDAEGRATYRLELTPDHTGALQVDAYYLALGSSLRRDGKLVYVEPADGLNIEVEADKQVYGPGEQAELTFKVTDAQGQGQASALGIQVVDEAVFGLMEFRPGLEKTYFQLEADLASPSYQIGVPGLLSLAQTPNVAEDPVRQEEAALLFAATSPTDAYPISQNSYARDQIAAAAIAKPFVNTAAEKVKEGLTQAALAGLLTYDNFADQLTRFEPVYDPWGRALLLSAEEDQLVVRSLGPDERTGTKDDVTVTYSVWEIINGWERGEGDWADGDFDGPPNAGGMDPVADDEEAAGGSSGDNGAESGPRVRRNFPETLYVEPSLITDASGEASLSLPLADSITTWRLTALANSANGLLGSTDEGVRVFQDFFVDIDFPATLTRGDEFSVPVALYNYLDVPQRVTVDIETAPWFTLLGPAQAEVDLNPGEVKGLRVPIRVDKVGVHELTIYARGDQLQDAVARTVRVVPDGQEVLVSDSGRLTETVGFDVNVPAEAIEGSPKLLVKLYPGLFSTVVEGLDAILRMPDGCFEQTSSSTWPNVLVLRYLRETGTLSPELELKATQYVNTGYQRLLTFEVDGGGFEWFGNPPSHVVLTAYGLLEFSDMALVRPVDEAMIARTRAWLLSQQAGDGHFEAARGLDETGNLSDPVTITAYTAFGLAAAGETSPALDRARTYLEAHVSGMGTYTLALFANFMVAYRPQDALTGRLLDQLAQRVEDSLESAEGQALPSHWQTDEQTTTYGNGEPAWIETTALATHALLVGGRHLDVANDALGWLVSKKDAYGAWGSTAGTVWTIKCMLAALRGGQDEDANATVIVRLDGEERARFAVTPENSDVMRQADLSALVAPGTAQRVEIALEGTGNLHYGIVLGHHIPWAGEPAPQDGPLSIEVTYDRTQLAVDDTATVHVRVANNDLAFADMVMVDLGIPPGFDVMTEDLDALKAEGVFAKYEKTERQLLLYFTAILPGEPIEFSYRVIARDPLRAEAPASRIYSYYNEAISAEARPVEIQVN